MNLPTKGLGRRAAHAALITLLMSTAATTALAAPKHKAHPAKAAPARDAKLEALQQQIDEMRAQMAQMQQTRNDQAEARVATLQQQLDTVNQQLADLKTAQTADASHIITLKSPPVTVALPNGKPAFASSDKRFTANIKAIVMLDAGKYYQKDNLSLLVTNRDLNDGTNFRRARFGINGKLFTNFDYALIYEFGGSGTEDAGRIQEAWIQYTGSKPFRFKVGYFPRTEHRPRRCGLHQPDAADGTPGPGRSGPQRRRRRQPQRHPGLRQRHLGQRRLPASRCAGWPPAPWTAQNST